MTRHLDTLLRETFTHQADRAPDGAAVRAVLDRRLRTAPRRGRPVRGWLPAGAAGLAAAGTTAVLIVPGLAAGGRNEAPGVPTPVVSSVTQTAEPLASNRDGFVVVPLAWTPTRLPKGLRETNRSASSGVLVRTWCSGPADLTGNSGGPRLDLDLDLRPGTGIRLSTEKSATAIRVGRAQGWLIDGGDKIVVQWRLADGTLATLVQIGLGLDRSALLDIATSLRPDDGKAVFPLSASVRGGGNTSGGYEVTLNDANHWISSLSDRDVIVQVGTRAVLSTPGALAAGRPVQVDGQAAIFYPASADQLAELVVTLADGRFLTVSVVTDSSASAGPADEDSLVAIAESVRWATPTFD